jgi:hypothetical protein
MNKRKSLEKLNGFNVEALDCAQLAALWGGQANQECCNGTQTEIRSKYGWVNWLIPPEYDWEDEGCC